MRQGAYHKSGEFGFVMADYWHVTKTGAHANCDVDGQFGSYTVRAVQCALNDGKL